MIKKILNFIIKLLTYKKVNVVEPILEPTTKEKDETPIIEQVEIKQPVETPKTTLNEVVEVKETYIPRTKAPSTTDKNFIKSTKGGYNYCMEIKNGSCLPNCVGYAWGRWRELLGKKHNLSRGNAENWYGNTKDGYKRGSTPKLGAVICWRKGKAGVSSDGAGHVAIVEKINSDGSILTSNSAYGSTRFYTKTLKKTNNYYMGSKYTFQGFIYLPKEFKTETTSKKETTYKVVKGDTLSAIAKKYGTSVTKIVNDNKTKYPKIRANYIQVGWNLIIK